MTTNSNGHSACGTLSSNFTLTVGQDNRFWATSRGGCVMDSDQVLGTYKVETDSVLPNLENNDNGDAEDEVIWYSGGYYHIVYNYWNVQRAYHIMSKDGVTNWTSTGLAYQASQSPANANSKWLRYTDGTVNQWHNMERPGVYQENGHVRYFTFAVTDVNKNASGVSNGGSKVLVVPFDGVQFDCDNGDAASCDEVGAGGAGGSGTGGAGGGGARGGSGGGVGGAAGRGGGGTAAEGAGGAGVGQSTGGGPGGQPGTGGASTGAGSGTSGASAGAGGRAAGATGGAAGSTSGIRRRRQWHDGIRRRRDGRRLREFGHDGSIRERRWVRMQGQSGKRWSRARRPHVAGEHPGRCAPTVAAARVDDQGLPLTIASRAERAPIRRWADVLESAEDLAEVGRVGESPFGGDLFDGCAHGEQGARRLLDAHLHHVSRRGEPGAGTKMVAEVTAAHVSLGRDLVDVQLTSRARQNTLAEPFEQTLSIALWISNLVQASLVREEKLEQRELHLVAVAEVFLERASYEADGAGDERARRRRRDQRPGSGDLLGDTTKDVGVVDADPRERPAWRSFGQVVAMAGGNDRKEARPGGDTPGWLPVELEFTPACERQLEEDQRPIALPEPSHPVPPIASRIRPRLDVPEVGVAGRPPGRPLDGGARCVHQAPEVRRPRRGRLWARQLSGNDVGLQNLERSASPEGGVRAGRLRAARLHIETIGRTSER